MEAAGSQNAAGPFLHRDHRAQVLVEMKIGDVAQQLGKVILSRGVGRMLLFQDIELGQGYRFIARSSELLGLFQS